MSTQGFGQHTRNVGTGYAPGKAVVAALQEAEAAFSGIQVQRTAVERLITFFCSKRGLTMLILFVAVSTHFKQTKSFLNSHVFRTSKTITTAALSDSSESSEISETGHDDSGGSSLTAPIRNASRQKEALSRHNSSTVESADSILEETN